MKKLFLKIWYWIVGAPADLTYWVGNTETKVRVKNFRDLSPNGISYTNFDNGKEVIVRAVDLKYVLKEE